MQFGDPSPSIRVKSSTAPRHEDSIRDNMHYDDNAVGRTTQKLGKPPDYAEIRRKLDGVLRTTLGADQTEGDTNDDRSRNRPIGK